MIERDLNHVFGSGIKLLMKVVHKVAPKPAI